MFMKIDGKTKFLNRATRHAALIRGLKMLGFEPILFSVWGGYEAFLAPNGVRYLVGRCGTLRMSWSDVRGSRSLTNSRVRKAIVGLGMGQSWVDVDTLRAELDVAVTRRQNLANYQC